MDDQVASQLFSLCASGDADALRRFLSSDLASAAGILAGVTKDAESPNAKRIVEKTLYVACSKGHYNVAKCLLKAGVNPNVNTTYGTPMFVAVKGGNLDIVKLLVEHGAEYNNIRGGYSPLFTSCVEGRLMILKFFVSRGANLNTFTNPPLVFTACASGHVDIMRYLLGELQQYDVNRTDDGSDVAKTDGRGSLLYTACQRNRIEMASYLVQQGAAITKTIAAQFPGVVTKLVQERIKPAGKDQPGFFHAKLKEMNLSDITWAAFASYASTLTKLDFRSNYLESLPSEIFQMPALKSLDISYNRLRKICSEDVSWMCSKLTELDASHNQLSCVPSGIFSLPELTSLCLSYNALATLPGDPEDPSAQSNAWTCESLKKLDLSHNGLKALPDTFGNLHHLTYLHVSHNSLLELPPSCSLGCINLIHLDACNNQLTDLPIGASNYWMHCLERLYLSNNLFASISRNITELSDLTILDLAHNKIEILPPSTHWTGCRLNKLDLSYNKLATLTNAEQQQQASSNEQVTRAKKPLEPTKSRQNIEVAIRIPGDELRELPINLWSSCLQTLFLQNNQLRFLPDYIGSLTNLTRLDISGNADIKCLPLKFGNLHNCWEINLNEVPVSNIPQHLLPGIHGGSTKHLLAYLRAQLRHCIPYNHMKLMVVGLQGRGKTTLLSVLRDINAPLPPNVSTVGVNMSKWALASPNVPKAKGKGSIAAQPKEITEVHFSTWDLAGQEVYYATHQCFLSRNTLYLVVWNMEEGDKGIEYLQPWLLNIQSRAPKSPVIIVGTHCDKLPPARTRELREQYRQKIISIYRRVGYPEISNVMCVSCLTKEGIKELQEKIYLAAIQAKDPDTNELIIGQQVPASYVALQKVISEEVKNCQAKEIPPVLNQKEFAKLAERIPDNDIIEPEELSVAAQFLHDNGVLLHYNDHLRGLNNLYFIDPIWLADMLAEVITVPEKQAFVQNGILKDSSVAFIFRDSKRFPSQFFQQYLQLLERFEIALSLGNGQRLIPSMLPVHKPDLNLPELSPSTTSKAQMVSCIRRRYKMSYIPSGFWSRLISRLIINLKRSGLVEDNQPTESNLTYWRRGILVNHASGRFLVESAQPLTSEISGAAVSTLMEASVMYVGDGVDGAVSAENHGVDITVWSTADDYSAMGYIVDELDSLIDEWFPGLNGIDSEGVPLVEKQAIWVPAPKGFRQPRPEEAAVVFSLEDCAAAALVGETIVTPGNKSYVPLIHLVPDLLLTDLDEDLIIDKSKFEFDPKNPANSLGRGGAAAVYRGKYKHNVVAIKKSLTPTQMENQSALVEEEDEQVYPEEALLLFRDFRQEVTVLSQLYHPNIVCLLGVSLRPMCIVLEFAPKGSLFGILDKRIDVIKSSQADAANVVPRMPGGVLGHMMSWKVALQVILAIRYLHEHSIIYRDLKSDNILVWSLEPKDSINVKLADYGISRFANPGGVKGEEGTPGYLAPEAIRRRGEDQAFDEKVDIFSFAMLLFELLTGQRPFENLTTIQEIYKVTLKGDRPLLQEGNLEPSFPSMINLMYDCWKQTAAERPSANEVVTRMCEPGFLCRKHTITRCRDHPLQKIDTIYARPAIKEDKAPKSYAIWTWAKQEAERQFSILDARKGVFNISEKLAPGGRVYAMTATGETEKRIWIGTAQCEIQVYGYRTAVGDPQCFWSFVVKDAVLSLTTEVEEGKVKRVFASLANGRLCIFSRTSVSGPSATTGDAELIPEACKVICDNEFAAEAQDWAEPLILYLADVNKPAKCMVFVGSDRLWCGCGNNITVVDSVNLKVLQQIPVFNKKMALVNELVSDGKSVWGVGRHLSCVMEWDSRTCALTRVFDCSTINPAANQMVVCGPKEFEDIFDPDVAKGTPPPPPPPTDEAPPHDKEDTLRVVNDPMDPSQTYIRPASRRVTRTLRTRPKPMSQTKLVDEARKKILSRLNGSTRTTTLVLVDETLWVGRGMGDVLVVDISGREGHGKVLARLATEDCEKYGNRSYHKLVVVMGEYVVSSQWLEPVEMKKAGCTCEDGLARQEIAIWDAWNHKAIESFSNHVSAMMRLDATVAAGTERNTT